ncbi:MAG: zeta toxin family protein [Acidimicrobiia bacterium]
MTARKAVSPPGPLIWVEDRYGTTLPYSKGLMAASIMATGLSPGTAYSLAAHIEQRLRSSHASKVRSELLITTAADVLRTEVGQDTCDRYLAWRSAKRSPRPLVVLIGGATGVGKSTVATKLAARLDINRMVTTDIIRHIMRGFLSPSEAPEIHRSSFESDGDIVQGAISQASTVSRGATELISRMVTERKDVIVEGVHLVPGIFPEGWLESLRAEAVVVQVLLVLDDPHVHRSHFLHRLENEHGRDAGRYLRHFDAIRQVQSHLVALAAKHAISTIDARSLDDAIQAVVDLVVAEVLASDRNEQAAVGS